MKKFMMSLFTVALLGSSSSANEDAISQNTVVTNKSFMDSITGLIWHDNNENSLLKANNDSVFEKISIKDKNWLYFNNDINLEEFNDEVEEVDIDSILKSDDDYMKLARNITQNIDSKPSINSFSKRPLDEIKSVLEHHFQKALNIGQLNLLAFYSGSIILVDTKSLDVFIFKLKDVTHMYYTSNGEYLVALDKKKMVIGVINLNTKEIMQNLLIGDLGLIKRSLILAKIFDPNVMKRISENGKVFDWQDPEFKNNAFYEHNFPYLNAMDIDDILKIKLVKSGQYKNVKCRNDKHEVCFEKEIFISSDKIDFKRDGKSYIYSLDGKKYWEPFGW